MDEIQKESYTKKEKKRGGGYPVGLHSPDHPKKGTAARPFDGGVLTHKGNACTVEWTSNGAASVRSKPPSTFTQLW
jgi:hypothetical protein